MTEKKETIIDREISLITIGGKKIIVSYKINANEDDYILDDLRKALKNNTIYSQDWINFNIEFNGHEISELDFSKIIGINWYQKII